MSRRKGLVQFVVAIAPFLFFSVATQTRAQSQGKNANAIVPLTAVSRQANRALMRTVRHKKDWA